MEDMIASHGEEFVQKNWDRLLTEIAWAEYTFDPATRQG